MCDKKRKKTKIPTGLLEKSCDGLVLNCVNMREYSLDIYSGMLMLSTLGLTAVASSLVSNAAGDSFSKTNSLDSTGPIAEQFPMRTSS